MGLNHEADILSCSWGTSRPKDLLKFAISQAASVGREGKGCGIFFSSGNNPLDTVYYPAMYSEVISVGALHPDDSVWSYSCYAKVDAVAPSGMSAEHSIWTLDQMDVAGYNTPYHDYGCGDPDDDDYNCKFGGTSAAQPIAAGVAALVLARKPDLTHDQLHDIIRQSADPNLYETISNPPHEKYGRGMVHPYRALLSIARGDVNADGEMNILDVIYLIDYKFKEGVEPVPEESMGDVDCDGMISVLDCLFLLNHALKGRPAPQTCFNYDLLE